MNKPILCLDFDGVIHSYASGWGGIDVIVDDPVPGVFEFLEKAVDEFEVNIYGSRSNSPEGIKAMERWFSCCIENHYDAVGHHSLIPGGDDKMYKILKSVEFVTSKPSAFVTLDDRSITFKGIWPSVNELLNFKPWNKE